MEAGAGGSECAFDAAELKEMFATNGWVVVKNRKTNIERGRTMSAGLQQARAQVVPDE